jgi:DNA-binding NarL/FixJ family response regulator
MAYDMQPDPFVCSPDANAMSNIRVLLADDHEVVREGLRAILSVDPEIAIIGEAADGESAVGTARALHPNIVVMDVTMRGMNGFQATQTLKECCPETDVVILTRHRHEAFVRECLRIGASGYVLKQSRSTELRHALHAVAQGGTFIDSGLNGATIKAKQADLSTREEQVMRLVAVGNGNKEIAATLNVSVKTIEAHKANAGQKLGFTARTQIVRYAQVRGWLSDF